MSDGASARRAPTVPSLKRKYSISPPASPGSPDEHHISQHPPQDPNPSHAAAAPSHLSLDGHGGEPPLKKAMAAFDAQEIHGGYQESQSLQNGSTPDAASHTPAQIVSGGENEEQTAAAATGCAEPYAMKKDDLLPLSRVRRIGNSLPVPGAPMMSHREPPPRMFQHEPAAYEEPSAAGGSAYAPRQPMQQQQQMSQVTMGGSSTGRTTYSAPIAATQSHTQPQVMSQTVLQRQYDRVPSQQPQYVRFYGSAGYPGNYTETRGSLSGLGGAYSASARSAGMGYGYAATHAYYGARPGRAGVDQDMREINMDPALSDYVIAEGKGSSDVPAGSGDCKRAPRQSNTMASKAPVSGTSRDKTGAVIGQAGSVEARGFGHTVCATNPATGAQTFGLDPSMLGETTLRVLWNRGPALSSEEDLQDMIALKSVFHRQLPNMPKSYIVRLLFDHRHRCLCLKSVVRNPKTGLCERKVIGGVCIRPFPEQQFAEIVFLAVITDEQVKGNGRRLMDYLKTYTLQDRIFMDGYGKPARPGQILYFLTYADNDAVGYFKKQGFNDVVSMPKDQWNGYIKDYDGGTLMECRLHPGVDYFSVQSMLQRQRQVVEGKVRTATRDVMPGLRCWEAGPIRVRVETIPGVLEAGYIPPTTRQSSRLKAVGVGTQRTGLSDLRARLASVLRLLMEAEDAAPFLKPVDTTEFPDYPLVVKEPMDFSTIEKRLNSMQYSTIGHFEDDVMAIVKACHTYNLAGSPVYENATEVARYLRELMHERGLDNPDIRDEVHRDEPIIGDHEIEATEFDAIKSPES